MKKIQGSKKLRRTWLSGACLLLALSMTGCSAPFQKDTARAQEGVGSVIYVIGQSKNVAFWDDVKTGAEEAGEDFDYDIHYFNAEDVTDIEGQMQIIKEAIEAHADAIVLAPNDKTMLNAVLEEAKSAIPQHARLDEETQQPIAGIPVITIDTDLDDSNAQYRQAYIGTINAQAGALAGRQAASYFEDLEVQKALIIGHGENNNACQERISTFRSALTGNINGRYRGAQAAKAAAAAAAAAAQQQAMAMAGVENTGMQEGAGGGAAAQQGMGGEAGGPPQGFGGEAGGPPQGMGGEAGGPPMDMSSLPTIDPISQVVYCDSVQAAKDTTRELLDNDYDSTIRVVFATNENTTIGVCQAIEEGGYTEQVQVIGFNANESEIGYLKRGILDGLILQNPYNMGYLGVYYAGNLIKGDSIPRQIDTGATYVNMDNLQNDEIQLLLNPKKYVDDIMGVDTKKEGKNNG